MAHPSLSKGARRLSVFGLLVLDAMWKQDTALNDRVPAWDDFPIPEGTQASDQVIGF